jgi:hypothetical protein
MAMLFLKVVGRILVALTYVVDTWKSIGLLDEVGESNLRTKNISFQDEVVQISLLLARFKLLMLFEAV